MPSKFTFPLIGTLNAMTFNEVIKQLVRSNLISDAGLAEVSDNIGRRNIYPSSYTLTLDGWEKYEDALRGKNSGNFGFIALKFGDPILDKLVNEDVKPGIKSRIGFDLIDMRDITQAGVIDNIMRNKIRDSAFVIVDLTHDNSGAYWEAGYAEGLGKPVIYICESEKFSKNATHFDTNHCTTVPWRNENATHFVEELVATLRRSLNLFETK